MSPGYQAVQSMHALRQFTADYPDIDRQWFEQSNYLGLLSVADEQELNRLIEEARFLDIPVSIFREPDVEDQVTAIALAPGPKSKKLCSNLKLALK
jgi:hypothetical protein